MFHVILDEEFSSTWVFELLFPSSCLSSNFFSGHDTSWDRRACRARTRACILKMAWTQRRVPTAWFRTKCPRTAACNLTTFLSFNSILQPWILFVKKGLEFTFTSKFWTFFLQVVSKFWTCAVDRTGYHKPSDSRLDDNNRLLQV